MRLLNEEKARADALEAELENARQAEAQRRLDAVVKVVQTPVHVEAALPPAHPSSMRPGILMVQAKGIKLGIPLALLIPLVTGLWAGVQYVMEFQRQFKSMSATIVSYEKRIEAQDKFIAAVREEQAKLRETQAAQAGWITGVMPKAGVNVPGNGIEVKSDPLPPGARRQTPVNVRTPVPTPPPF